MKVLIFYTFIALFFYGFFIVTRFLARKITGYAPPTWEHNLVINEENLIQITEKDNVLKTQPSNFLEKWKMIVMSILFLAWPMIWLVIFSWLAAYKLMNENIMLIFGLIIIGGYPLYIIFTIILIIAILNNHVKELKKLLKSLCFIYLWLPLFCIVVVIWQTLISNLF